MTKTHPIGIRFSRSEREALETAAGSDDRTLSAYARKLVVDALQREGWLIGKRNRIAAGLKSAIAYAKGDKSKGTLTRYTVKNGEAKREAKR